MDFDNIIDKRLSFVEKNEIFNKYANEMKVFKLFEIDSVTYYSNKKEGILFIFNEFEVLTSIHFYGEGHKEYSSFKDELPFGIKLTDSSKEVEAKYGKKELKRGGGEMLPILGKSNNWIMYLIDSNCYRFEFKDDKICLLTLSNQFKEEAVSKY